MAIVFVGRQRCRQQSRDDGLVQPVRERGIEESVLDEIGGPGLQPSVSELFPSWLRCAGDLDGCEPSRSSPQGDHKGVSVADAPYLGSAFPPLR